MADWLVSQGARHLILTGRSGATTGRARRRLNAWREAGVYVGDEAVDFSDAGAVADLIDRSAADMPALRAVFHVAGVSEDQGFEDVTAESIRRVVAPKVDGAWNLHDAVDSRGIELDAFVLFSSVSAVVGPALQTIYAAANAGLDALAQLRHSQGKPALSVNWGALHGGGGMAEASAGVRRYLEVIGHKGIPIDRVPELLAVALSLGDDVTNAVVADVDWWAWTSTHPSSNTSTRFADFAADRAPAGPS